MPKTKAKRFTNIRNIIRKDHLKIKTPMIEEFVRENIREKEGSRVTCKELHGVYLHWLRNKTNHDKQVVYISTFIRFCRQVHKLLPGNPRRVRNTGGKTAFSGIALTRPVLRSRIPVEDFRAKAKKFLEEDNDVPIKVQKVSDRRDAGRCAFALRDIQKGEIVTEFKGEVVPMEEMLKREQQYEQSGLIPATLIVSRYNKQDVAIDPHGVRPFPVSARINHSKRNSNLKMVIAECETPRVVLISKCCIPQGIELLFNYGDREADFYDSSQTIESED